VHCKRAQLLHIRSTDIRRRSLDGKPEGIAETLPSETTTKLILVWDRTHLEFGHKQAEKVSILLD